MKTLFGARKVALGNARVLGLEMSASLRNTSLVWLSEFYIFCCYDFIYIYNTHTTRRRITAGSWPRSGLG